MGVNEFPNKDRPNDQGKSINLNAKTMTSQIFFLFPFQTDLCFSKSLFLSPTVKLKMWRAVFRDANFSNFKLLTQFNCEKFPLLFCAA